jgi:hypothetical protein
VFVPLTLNGGSHGKEEKSEESGKEKEKEEGSKEESQKEVVEEAHKEKSGQEKACAKKGEGQEEGGHETGGVDVWSGGSSPLRRGSIRGENRPEPCGRLAVSNWLKTVSG